MPRPTPEEHRWLQALELAQFGVWDLDPRLETVQYSPPWKARFGFAGIAAADSTWFWRCRVHPDDFDGMLGSLRRHLDGHADRYAMHFRLRSNGAGYRTVLSRGRVVSRDASGLATRVVGTMIDLTTRPMPPHRRPLVAGGARDASALQQALPIEQVDDLLDIALRESAASA
ncbi:MAG: PAS domain-containing protein [Piscinibacter sp.]|uniref:PAS domain-containing protein n=1 Tax=Piscinibacter sp. TaxID=1903157 RepID=UPI003D13A285